MSAPPPAPRSRRRWLWIFLGGFFLGGVVFLGLLLAPPVQGWLLRRFVATQPGWRLDFERIGVGPTGLDARGLAFTMPGVEASTAPLAIRVAPTRLFSKRELRVEQIEARKIRLTLTPALLATAPARTGPAIPPTPFDGLLRLLQAPLPWALDTAHLDGEIVVRDAGQSRLTGAFSLRGGGLSAATPGEFTYEISADSLILPPGPDHQLTSAGTVAVVQTPGHGIARLTIDGDLHLPRYGELVVPPGHLHLDVAGSPTGETYAANLTLGSALTLTLDAALDNPKSTLAGRITLHADQSLAASLLGSRLPRATADGTFTFSLNLRNGDLDAALSGDFDGRDWEKILPQLAVLDAFKGRLTAALTRRGDALKISELTATLRGERTPASASLTLAQPFDPRLPPAAPVVQLALEHWPVEWANPFLADSGVQLAPAEFNAAWTVSYDLAPTVKLTPVRPATLGPIALRGEKIPPLPAFSFSFSPVAEISPARATLTIADFTATTPAGDRVDAQIALTRDAATGQLRSSGELHGSTPTLLAGAEAPLPFLLNSKWAAQITGDQLQLSSFEFAARPTADTAPYLSLQLERPFDFNLAKLAATAGPNDLALDWLRLRVAEFPLAWLSHWLPGNTIAGTWAAGESAIRPASGGGFALHTPASWRFNHVSFAPAGATPFPIDAELAPAVTVLGDHVTAAFENLAVADASANRLTGRIAVDAALKAKTASAEVALEASLPNLPHSAGTFGPLQASLRAKFHNMSVRIVGADEFSLRVNNASGPLATIEAPQPFIFGLSNTNMVVLSTLSPIQLKLAGFPLAWLQPWTDGLTLAGTFAPAELQLAARIDRYGVRPLTPLKLEGISVRRGDRELLPTASLSLQPGLDLTFICVTAPTFQIAFTGTAHATDVQLDFDGRRALDLDLALGFKGNDKLTIPDLLNLSARSDFSAIPNAPTLGLPPRGILVARINGELLGAEPVELWTRLTGVPDAENPQQSLPPVELTLLGKISREQVFTGGVELLVAGAPQPSDLKFDVSMNLIEGGLKITSGLHSQFLDGAALLAYARAFPSSTTPAAPAAPAPRPDSLSQNSTRVRPANYATLPFWSQLSGSFDLDLGAVQFAPYRIDRVRGRLDVDDTTLDLHDLSGEMFAGRWGGGLRIVHPRGSTTAEHNLTGEFHIEQFESARVVQTVFPNQLASIDARINVHAQVASTGNSFITLIDHSAADFSVDGANGVVRLSVPKADLVSTAAVFGGTVLLSPELRALGRLLKKFAEMPVEQIRITGRRAATGEVSLNEFRFESPQARLLGHGRIPLDAGQPLMNRPLELSLELAAKDELAVILGGMSLLEKKPRTDGFRAMRQPFALGGRAGAPDTAPLYDLLAKAASGSSGTWGFLMRKVQTEVGKKKISAAKPAP